MSKMPKMAKNGHFFAIFCNFFEKSEKLEKKWKKVKKMKQNQVRNAEVQKSIKSLFDKNVHFCHFLKKWLKNGSKNVGILT